MPVPFHSSLSESVTLQNLVNASQYNELRGTVQSSILITNFEHFEARCVDRYRYRWRDENSHWVWSRV